MTARRVRLLIACLAAIATSAQPQNRINTPWWTSDVVRDLGLSPAQTQRIRQTVRSYRDRLFDARNNVQKAEADLEDILNDPEVNMNAARAVIERLAQARANSTRVFTEMSVQMRSILTQDQWRELARRWADVQRTKKGHEAQVPP